MKTRLFIEGNQNGYSPAQCGRTMKVGEFIEYLAQFEYEAPVYLRNDNGYTYGRITERDFSDDEYDEEEDD